MKCETRCIGCGHSEVVEAPSPMCSKCGSTYVEHSYTGPIRTTLPAMNGTFHVDSNEPRAPEPAPTSVGGDET